jgi:hypothetical protein
MSALKDLTGQVRGRLTALRCIGRTEQGKALWICRCSCDGKEIPVVGAAFTSGNTKSCGCILSDRKIRDLSPTTYKSWESMMQRCTNPNCERWSHYGGANPPITVCERWRDFRNFLADMGERPDGTSLGRFGDVGNYEPGNCAWQSAAQQAIERKKHYALLSVGRKYVKAA